MDVALFPLNAVLFPQGVLPLRVFEPRYMDMVRTCLREDRPFGVCRLLGGSEVGAAALPEPIGCLATIESWDMQQLGLLHLRALGGARFRVLHTRVAADRLLRAEIEVLPADADGPVDAEHQPCVDLLRRIIDDLSAPRPGTRSEPGEAAYAASAPFAAPLQLDSRAWVGNRLCELLPISLAARQKLMELDDAAVRLDLVLQYLRQHAILE